MKKYFIMSNMILLAIMLFFGIKGMYKIMAAQLEQNNLPVSVSNETLAFKDQPTHPQSYYKSISGRNLFKTQEEAIKEPVKEVPDKPQELEQTKLKLKLWGTITGDVNKAIIEDKKERKQNLYREGDAIQTATVKEISRGKVILSVNGKDEILEMEKKQASKRSRRPSKTSVARKGVGKPTSETIRLDRSEIEEAVSDVTSIMKQVKIRPHFKNGKPDGLSLSRIRPNSIFSKLGLRSGDVISGVDGEQIESVDDALKFYKSLKSSSSVSLEIKRRGRLKTIEYNID